MDYTAAWDKVGAATKAARRFSAERINQASAVADAAAPLCAPFAARWDAEADRRRQLRTEENLKALLKAQKEHNSARVQASSARSQRALARRNEKNPLSSARRSAKRADKAASKHARHAKQGLAAARKNYPATLTSVAAKAHAAHASAAGLSSYVLSTGQDWTVWPASVSAVLIAANVGGLLLGRRKVTASVSEEVSEEERQLMERLDPSYWVEHADARGLGGTVTTPPAITTAGIECEIRLDGQWTVKKLRTAADSVRALLGARTELPMLVAAAARGGWAVIRLRTRSAAPDGAIPFRPGDALGVDMVTGEEVDVPLGLRMLIAGMSGAGKSTASRPLLFKASEGPENVLVIIDLKKVEGRLWDHRARVAHDPAAVVELVDELVAELEERLDVLPKGQATLIPTAERPRITLVVDEGAEVMSSCTAVETVTGYTDKGKAIGEKRDALEGLDSIARMGRAACIDLWWMTQSPTYGDGVPRQIAKQLGTRLGLAVESPTEARVVFGESAQDKGWRADELPMPGVAMLRDGQRSPDPVKVRFMTDQEVVNLPDTAIWQRPDTPAPRPSLSLVKDEEVPAPRTEAPQPAEATNRDRVLNAVRCGARSAAAVVTETGLNKGTVSREIKALVTAGALVKADDGTLTHREAAA
ncbi:FtsK/SpoIIIE domain-containing protein [Streptomyces sp. NPDC006992]|uniref:FtsK/SpoIIIE domain-containing protein n=1 Tax=Streptomyces sp. NPDC006992 TaxID=3155601 RepID=UPI0034080959